MTDEGYRKLEIYKRSHELAVKVHALTLTLPKFEMYEEGSQIRRSAKSVSSNIVEGYSLRKYKNEFLLYLNRAYASAEETIEHLQFLYDTKSLKDEKLFKELIEGYEEVCKMIFKFMQTVLNIHEKPYSVKEDEPSYL
ncbi:MAG: four helix bundle protein [Bacteroidota bacterium]|nr:four helix bundle protein [Bacteroidota bacterium]